MNDGAVILVVEDDVIIAMRLQDTLESWGFKTHACYSGAKAVELAQHVQPDLALLDINLNGKMDGIQAAAELRRLGCASIFLTAYSDDELLERAKAAEPYGYLVKPVYDRELRSTVEMALVKQRADRRLLESERRFRAMFEKAGLGVALVNTQTRRLIMANAKHWEILGLPETDYTADYIFRTLTHPEDIPRQEALMERLIRGEVQDFSLEKRYLIPGRGVVWVYLTISATWEPGETPTSHVIIMNDITERKQADEALRLRVAELEAMNRISNALRFVENLGAALPMLLDELLQIVQAADGAIALYENNHPGPDALATRGWPGEVNELFSSSAGLAGVAMIERGALSIDDFAADPRLPAAQRAGISAGWGGVILPILAVDHALGVALVSTPLPRRLNEAETRLLETVTSMAGSAVQRIRLFEQQARSLNRIAALHEIDNAIRSNLDLASTLKVILEHVCLQVGADAAAVLLVASDGACLYPATDAGLTDSMDSLPCVMVGVGLAGRAALERRRMVGGPAELAAEPEERRSCFAREQIRRCFSVPLISKDQVTGVLEVYYRSRQPEQMETLDFLDVLAGQAAVAVDARRLIESLKRSNQELNRAYHETIEGWSRAMDLRDRETEGHTLRVTELSSTLARRMGFTEEKIEHMRRGALLHDIGKIGVPDQILLKPGGLNDEEWVVMRTHPQWAYDLLSPIEHLRQALEIPYCHHERWDGTGYPRGLAGEEIPLAARMFAVVDVFDALTSDRPYRPAWTVEKTSEYLRENAGRLFDPEVVVAFLELMSEARD